MSVPSASNSWLTQMPSTPKLWFDTDIGNDIDDVLALLFCLHYYGRENLVGVSTTFYRPDQKARIAKTILNEYQFNVPVYGGIGIYDPEKDGNLLKTMYGPWPQRFGIPWSKESLSAKEASAYRKLFSKFDAIPVERNGVEAMKKAVETHNKDLIILSIGFPTNIAAAMDTIQKNRINRIVIMGGWFEDDNGGIKRVGYNTVIDLAASKKILQQSEVPVLIVSSEFCSHFAINKAEYLALQEKGTKVGSRAIARAICEDMKVWMDGKDQVGSENMVHIGDPIAAYLSLYPQEIAEAYPVEIEVSDYVEGVDMFNPDCKNYLRVKKVSKSNIMVVKSVKDKEKMRKTIVDAVSRSFDWKKF